MKFCALVLLLAGGCSFEKDTFLDGGLDGFVDGGDLAAPMPDCGLCGNLQLCTTAACAQSPCTAGCEFVLANNCPSALPSLIDQSKVTACSGVCGFFTGVGQLGCGVYNGAHAGCGTCGYNWGASSCVDVNPMIDYQVGAAICQSGETCFNGTPPQDASVNCDMFPRD
jgi:hypothetical protein